MLFVDNRGITDARVNLALEEYVLRTKLVDDDCVLFYVNAPAIIIGRNQNTIEEIDPDVVAAQGIHVVRRISGGGAVYHDFGNLNFSFMTAAVADRFNRYDHFTRPIIEVLREIGVPAELGGRNDILAMGRKISGNAQFATPHRMFSHGTLLVDSDLDAVTAALRPKPGKVESKGVKSIRSRVANISEFAPAPITVDRLLDRILEGLFGTRDRAEIPSVTLTDADWSAVHELVARRYGTWTWNYGEDPAFNVLRSHRFPAGEIEARVDVQNGRIEKLRVFGDFMGRREVAELEELLHGVAYDRTAIRNALQGFDVRDFFGDVELEDVLSIIAG